MKKIIIAIIAAVALTACSIQPVPLVGNAKTSGLLTVGTLATVGTCEMDVAADWSALELHRRVAANRVTTGRITPATARQVLALGDAARASLLKACPNQRATLDVSARDSARATLKTIASLLEKKP